MSLSKTKRPRLATSALPTKTLNRIYVSSKAESITRELKLRFNRSIPLSAIPKTSSIRSCIVANLVADNYKLYHQLERIIKV